MRLRLGILLRLFFAVSVSLLLSGGPALSKSWNVQTNIEERESETEEETSSDVVEIDGSVFSSYSGNGSGGDDIDHGSSDIISAFSNEFHSYNYSASKLLFHLSDSAVKRSESRLFLLFHSLKICSLV